MGEIFPPLKQDIGPMPRLAPFESASNSSLSAELNRAATADDAAGEGDAEELLVWPPPPAK